MKPTTPAFASKPSSDIFSSSNPILAAPYINSFDKFRLSDLLAKLCTIDDSSITNPTSDVAINASDYGTDLNGTDRNDRFTDAMTYQTQTFGRIGTIEISSHGSGYEAIPTATVENDYYSNSKYDNKKLIKKTQYHIGKFAVIR